MRALPATRPDKSCVISKKNEPEFWDQLTQKATVEVDIPANESIAEDKDVIDPLFEDDSDLSCDTIIANVLESQPAGTKSTVFGDIISTAAAELLDANKMASSDAEGKDDVSVAELGCGKRMWTTNKLYNSRYFWQHNDADASDQE